MKEINSELANWIQTYSFRKDIDVTWFTHFVLSVLIFRNVLQEHDTENSAQSASAIEIELRWIFGTENAVRNVTNLAISSYGYHWTEFPNWLVPIYLSQWLISKLINE